MRNIGSIVKQYIGIIILVIILTLMSLVIYFNYKKLKESESREDKLKVEIIMKDSVRIIEAGKYAKLTNYYKTEKELNTHLKNTNIALYEEVKKNKEKVLLIADALVTFKSKSGKISYVKPTDSTYTFESFYPDKEKSFAKYSGSLNTKDGKITESWTFNKFKMQVVLTELQNGIWDYKISLPDYAVVSDVKVNALPPKKFTPDVDKPKIFGFYGGAGVRANLNNFQNKALVVKGGISIKDKFILTGDLGTDLNAGTGFLVRF